MANPFSGDIVLAPKRRRRRDFAKHERLTQSWSVHGVLSQSGRKYIRIALQSERDADKVDETPIYIPLGDFHDFERVLSALLDAEMIVPYNPYLNQLRHEIAQIKEFPRHSVLERPGWDDNVFVWRDATCVRIEPMPGMQVREGKASAHVKFDQSRRFWDEAAFRGNSWRAKVEGDEQVYLDGLSQVLVGQDLLTFALLLGLTPPLLRWSSIESFAVTVVGTPASGTRQLLQIAASAWGEPTEAGELERGESLTEHLETELPLASDHLLILPEVDHWFALESASRRAEHTKRMANLFRYKHEFPSGALFRPPATVVLATSERPLEELCDRPDGARALLADRFMTIAVPTDRTGGVVVEAAAGSKTPQALLRELSALVNAHHGHAAPRFVQGLLEGACDRVALRACIANHIEEFVALTGLGIDADGAIDAARLGLVFAAGRLAKEYGVIPEEVDTDQAILAVWRMLTRTPDFSVEDQLRALAESTKVIHLLGGSDMQCVSDDERAAALGYLKKKGGSTLLCVRVSDIARAVSDWAQKEHSPEVEKLLVYDVERDVTDKTKRRHRTKQVVLGKGRKKERAYCFSLSGP